MAAPEEDHEQLRRLDSIHLNQLTAKAFEKKPKETNQDNESEDPSPIKKFGQMKLEAIDEIDSFCTDSSYQPSPEFFAKSATQVDTQKFLDV
jgi:hypothetical protein